MGAGRVVGILLWKLQSSLFACVSKCSRVCVSFFKKWNGALWFCSVIVWSRQTLFLSALICFLKSPAIVSKVWSFPKSQLCRLWLTLWLLPMWLLLQTLVWCENGMYALSLNRAPLRTTKSNTALQQAINASHSAIHTKHNCNLKITSFFYFLSCHFSLNLVVMKLTAPTAVLPPAFPSYSDSPWKREQVMFTWKGTFKTQVCKKS